MGKRPREEGGGGSGLLACVLLVGNQSMAFRMTKFFSGAYGGCDLGRLFPPRFRGKQVAELGPRTSNLGPRMVLLRGMEGSPEEFAAFMQSHPLLPYYVHRMFWVDMEAPAVPRAGLAAAIAERWREGGWGGGVRLQLHPKREEGAFAEELNALVGGPECAVRGYEAAVSALPLSGDGEELLEGGPYRLGIHSAASLYLHPAGAAKLSSGPSKAQSKIDEALLLLGELPGGNGAAVDLGAAPGAWTASLARRFERVFAVDPAPMDPQVLALENVTHIQKKAEDSVGEVRAQLPPSPGGGGGGGGEEGSWGANLLVCDMNVGLHEVGAAVQGALPLLRSGARVVVTLKLRGRGRDTAERAAILGSAIGKGVRMLETVWMLGNTNHERCFLGVKI